MYTGAGRPEILFATIAAGGGHVATARAMAEVIERYYPGEFDLRVSDYMKEVGVTGLDRRHKDSWRRALRYPALARTGQRLIDAFPRPAIAAQRLYPAKLRPCGGQRPEQTCSLSRSLQPRPRNHRPGRGPTALRPENARAHLRHRTPQHQRLLGRTPRRPHRRSLRRGPARPPALRCTPKETNGRRLSCAPVFSEPSVQSRSPGTSRAPGSFYLPRRLRRRGGGRQPAAPDRDPAGLRHCAPGRRCNGT